MELEAVMEMTMVKARAPGCFGAASVYAQDSTVCKGCVAFVLCGEASTQTLENIRSVIDVSDILARHAKARQKAQASSENNRQAGVSNVAAAQPAPVGPAVERKTPLSRVVFELSEDQTCIIARIASSKCREQAIVLCKQNRIEPARAEMHQGINPFAESGPRYLRVACALLMGGGFTRAALKTALMTELAWKDTTAASHVAITCALFTAFDIAIETKGAFTLSPAPT